MNKVSPAHAHFEEPAKPRYTKIANPAAAKGIKGRISNTLTNSKSDSKLTERSTSFYPKSEGANLKAILPEILNEQNRKTLGTWQRQLDFTRTIIGYLLGIHNFFRFPYLCYKYGGIFFVPYIVMMIFVGVPVVFMEFTIGQYCGVGYYVAFTHLAPILNGVSKLLTWSCVVNCWMYCLIMAWLRIYSNDSTSCLKGWETCNRQYYYSSPHCFTGAADDECNDPSINPMALNGDMLYYNYECRTVEYYCTKHGWKDIPGTKNCTDEKREVHSIYERRYHATQEFFYGAVVGLQRKMEYDRKRILINETVTVTGKSLQEIRMELNVTNTNATTDGEAVRGYLEKLEFEGRTDSGKKSLFLSIYEKVADAVYQKVYWTLDGRRLTKNPDSYSASDVRISSLTTWIMVAVFLLEDLLKISFLSYILNAVPFVILVYNTAIAVSFSYSGYGIDNLLMTNNGFFKDLLNAEMWAEAVIQVIYTTGIGNGVLISLATFNNFDHSYLIDVFCTLGLSIITSCCGVLLCFCTIGHYLKLHNIDVPFRDYIQSEAVASSMEFSFVAYSHFLTLIAGRNVVMILFFFMVTSFATDTAIRLSQNVIDAIIAIAPRFKYHQTMVLVAVCCMGYLILVPAMKNGGIVLFIDFEYFTIRYMIPMILLIQIGAILFVYKATRVIDNAEQMGVFNSLTFRRFVNVSSYISFGAMLFTVVVNILNHQKVRFNGEEAENFTETFGWVFFTSPLLMALLSVIKQLIVVPRVRWWWLLIPLMGKDRKLRRAFLRRIQGGKGKSDRRGDGETDHEAARAAALRWRTLEARLLLNMMVRRKEADAKKLQKAKLEGSEQEGEKRRSSTETKKSFNELEESMMAMNMARVAAQTEKKVDGGGGNKQKESSIKSEDKTGDDSEHEEGSFEGIQRRKAFLNTRSNSFCAKLNAAFLGKAMHSDNHHHRPKRHVGGTGYSRLVTKKSISGEPITVLSEEEDKHSQESLSLGEEAEKTSLNYLDLMDYIERWPGRLDESEIESGGTSSDDFGEEED